MKLSVAAIVFAFCSSAVAKTHTEYRHDGSIGKIFKLQAMPPSASAVPSSTKKRCKGRPTQSSGAPVSSTASTPPVDRSGSATSSAPVDTSSSATSSALVDASSSATSSAPLSSSSAPPPPVCVPTNDACTIDTFTSCCTQCCYFPTNDIQNGQCC
ncbi:hypothetical protein B0T25DRAFT_557272 [Lasiosphaeria hispida]|uniref:Uncharacterized protein n=1 Tax=Lasiosphaeria hispida TaxID=260671 RepID=A0AAJ0MA01_9PEZI|nr:hypothetical protein B0T25DRAFT_557272 [Lasiosphaeria hispida]